MSAPRQKQQLLTVSEVLKQIKFDLEKVVETDPGVKHITQWCDCCIPRIRTVCLLSFIWIEHGIGWHFDNHFEDISIASEGIDAMPPFN